jgi:mannose-6-phosphate isomerase-like protein (cupin superfamily)
MRSNRHRTGAGAAICLALAASAQALAYHQPSAPPAVLHFHRAAVQAAFARGGVLVGADDHRNFMVHASRREKAGVAEVHALDADVIHVLDGTATLVTGGTIDEAREVEPNELRGPSISGGDSRTLASGDVIVIPAGMPHWFREVPTPVTYFVVKVRR